MASINIYTGPMASGKTSKMIEQLHKYSNVTKEKVLLITFEGDDRVCSDTNPCDGCYHGVSTHVYGDSSMKIPIGKYIDTMRVNCLEEIGEEYLMKYNIMGIDESQFFPDLESFVRKYGKNDKFTFYISGLSFDSDNKPFGQTLNLLDIATTFEKMTAICSLCDPRSMKPAAFTYAEAKKTNVIAIGGLEMYKPLCYFHYCIKNN